MAKEKDLDKQIELCKKLGATDFQKLVFLVEKIKFKVLKTLVPNYIKYFDKHVDRITNKKLKYANAVTPSALKPNIFQPFFIYTILFLQIFYHKKKCSNY